MPKKQLTDSLALNESAPTPSLAGWQATGLCVAAVALTGASGGLGGLLGAVLFAPVIYALVRLRRHAPGAVSTAGLVGSTLGRRAAALAGGVQILAYSALVVTSAQGIALVWLPVEAPSDPFGELVFSNSLWSLYAVTALVIAGVLVFALPERVTIGLATALAAGGLLIHFYLGLAIVATILSGGAPDEPHNAAPPTTGVDAATALVVLAVGIAGFEVITTRRRRGTSSGWSMGLALGIVAVCAAIVSWAGQLGANGLGPFDRGDTSLIAEQLYGSTGTNLITAASTMIVVAGMLALLWGIIQIVGRLGTEFSPETVYAGVLAAMVILTVAVTQLRVQFGYVGGLLLVTLYAIVLTAFARIPGDSVVTWWLRIVMPVVLVAIVLLPLVDAQFSIGALIPVVIAAALVAISGAVAAVTTRSRAD